MQESALSRRSRLYPGSKRLNKGENTMPSWLPLAQADRLIWLQNFVLKLGVYVGTAGITAADVTFATGVRDAYQWILNRSDQIKTVAQDINEWKSIFADGPIGTPLGAYPVAPAYPAPPLFVASAGMFAQVIALCERIRNTTGYTTAIGEDLGIVPPGGGGALGDPTCTATALPNSEVRLDWVKGSATGVLVESQRAGETEWTSLGTDTVSPFVDSRAPLVAGAPEVRRYRIRYLVNDLPVGNYSAVVSVTTVP
jgi:hypothetical protein